jgi:sigma-B regulation protein RsbU (phosphoserine phosphatase)
MFVTRHGRVERVHHQAFYVVLILLYVGILLYVNHVRRHAQLLRVLIREAQKEQEAVLSLIDKLGEQMTTKFNLTDSLQIITEYIVQATRAESGAIFVMTADERELKAEVVIGPFPPLNQSGDYGLARPRQVIERIRADRIRVGEGIVGQVAIQSEPLLVTDAQADPRVPAHASLLGEVHSIILCPLRVRGRNLGVIVVVNKLGEAIFDSRDMALLQALADQAAVTIDLVKLYDMVAEQQRLEQELALARDFQRMLLPDRFPELPGYELHAVSDAAKVVGGDFYDVFDVDADHVGLAIADVTGKGIPGALIMAMTRSVLRAEARGDLSPKNALRRVNRRLLDDTRENVFVTMIYAILHKASGRLRFVRAGHEPLLLLDDAGGPPVEWTPPGIALGLVGEEVFEHNEEVEIQLIPGQTVLLYTDGLVEAADEGHVEYGRDRLAAKLQDLGRSSARALVESLLEDVRRHTQGAPQSDDVTILALRMASRPESSMPEKGAVA